MDEFGQRSRRGLRPPPREAGQAREHGVRLLEPDIRDLGAVAGVPAKRRPLEPSRVVDQEEDEFQRVREADEVELGCRRQSHRRVPRVEGAAEAGVGGALGGHRTDVPMF